MRILYVDENRAIGELLQKRLAPPRCIAPDGSAFEVVLEIDYGKALAALANGHRYDATIVEIAAASSSDGIGLDIVRSLKGKPTLAVVLTASPSIDNCIEAMLAGAADYVAKVGSIDAIAQRLVQGFERAARERAPADVDALYVEQHYTALANDYADRWIAVGRGRFLGAADTYDELARTVASMRIEQAKFWRMPPRVEQA